MNEHNINLFAHKLRKQVNLIFSRYMFILQDINNYETTGSDKFCEFDREINQIIAPSCFIITKYMAQNMQLIKSKFVLFSLAHDAFRKYFSRNSKNALLHFETSWKKLLISDEDIPRWTSFETSAFRAIYFLIVFLTWQCRAKQL